MIRSEFAANVALGARECSAWDKASTSSRKRPQGLFHRILNALF